MSQNLKNGEPQPCFSFSRQGGYEAALRAMKRSLDRLHVFLQIPFLIIMSGANASCCGV